MRFPWLAICICALPLVGQSRPAAPVAGRLDGVWSGGAWGDVTIAGNSARFANGVQTGTVTFEPAGDSYDGTWRESSKIGGAVSFALDPGEQQIRGRFWADPSERRTGEVHVLVWRRKTPAPAGTPTCRLQVLDNREKFDELLHGFVRLVDFDDIDTSVTKPQSFEADRYENSKGVLIEGDRGQHVCTEWAYPTQFVAHSKPNTYAPGPANGDRRFPKGGSRTDVRFSVRGAPASVAGFGCMFHDVDNTHIAKSFLIAFDRHGRELGRVGGFRTPDGGKVWRGVVAVNDEGVPMPVIARVRLVTGDGWPERPDGEGVSTDDFAFSIPVGWRKAR